MKKVALILLVIFIGSCSCKKNSTDAAPGSLEGNWELTSMSDHKSDFESVFPNAKPTINFNVNDTKVTGKNSCNSYGGSFSLDGIFLRIDEKTLFSTKMFCEGIGEKTFMDVLGKVNAYSISQNGTTLSLWKGKTELMRFRKA